MGQPIPSDLILSHRRCLSPEKVAGISAGRPWRTWRGTGHADRDWYGWLAPSYAAYALVLRATRVGLRSQVEMSMMKQQGQLASQRPHDRKNLNMPNRECDGVPLDRSSDCVQLMGRHR